MHVILKFYFHIHPNAFDSQRRTNLSGWIARGVLLTNDVVYLPDFSFYLRYSWSIFTSTSLVGKTNEEFDADRKARELRKKLSIHDPMELWSTLNLIADCLVLLYNIKYLNNQLEFYSQTQTRSSLV